MTSKHLHLALCGGVSTTPLASGKPVGQEWKKLMRLEQVNETCTKAAKKVSVQIELMYEVTKREGEAHPEKLPCPNASKGF